MLEVLAKQSAHVRVSIHVDHNDQLFLFTPNSTFVTDEDQRLQQFFFNWQHGWRLISATSA
jgi:hypothetical protein